MMSSIRKAIFQLLKSEFPTHTLYGEKVPQGLKKPCFFITFLPVSTTKLSKYQQQREVTIDIQYLSQEETNEKNIEMGDMLTDLFQQINFDGYSINVTEMRYEIVDDILHFFIDLNFILLMKDDEPQDYINEVYKNGEAF